MTDDVPAGAGVLHHVELWVTDLAAAERSVGWLLGALGYAAGDRWPGGVRYDRGPTYVVLESGPDVSGPHERLRAGVNHLAFHAGTRADVDRLAAAAPAHGWSLLFADRHPFAGGPDHYAAYLEDGQGLEVELVATTRVPPRAADGSAGDVDYAAAGVGYARFRRPDPRVAAAVEAALGDARTVVNVGAGAGSYEPVTRTVTAVEPSASMRAQRPAHLAPAVDAVAERLPFPDDAFDAALATFSVHQWRDLAAGLGELRRTARGPVVVLTCDPELLDRFWLADYAPEVLAVEASRYPAPAEVARLLGRRVTVTPVPVPLDCTDGFGEAYYGRPEALLDPDVRRSQSAWSFVGPEVHERFVTRLGADLASGAWDARYGALRTQPTFEGSLVLVVARP